MLPSPGATIQVNANKKYKHAMVSVAIQLNINFYFDKFRLGTQSNYRKIGKNSVVRLRFHRKDKK